MRKILFAALVVGAHPAFADESVESDFRPGGLRIEAHAGIERPTLNDSQGGVQYVDKLSSSFTYGGEIGFDIAVSDKVTVGPYVSLDAGGSNKCETYTPINPGTIGSACFHSNSNISGGVRVAYASPKDEFYMGVGYSSYDTDFSLTERNTSTSAIVYNYTNNDARGGVDFTMGWNHTVAKHVYVGLGFKIGSFGEFEGTGFSLQRAQGHAALGFRF